MSTSRVMLSTIDNPFNPFTDWDNWLQFDESSGYFTNSLLARIANSSDELSDADQELELAAAIDEIVKENASGVHKAVHFSDIVE